MTQHTQPYNNRHCIVITQLEQMLPVTQNKKTITTVTTAF